MPLRFLMSLVTKGKESNQRVRERQITDFNYESKKVIGDFEKRIISEEILFDKVDELTSNLRRKSRDLYLDDCNLDDFSDDLNSWKK